MPQRLSPDRPDPASRQRLAAMPSGDLESERQWIEAQLEYLGRLALEGENVGAFVAQYQADMDALMAEIQGRLHKGTLPRGGTRPSCDRALIDRVQGATDIVALVQASGVVLKKAGKNFKGLCPFHTEKTPSFVVFAETHSWYCFGCHQGGDAIAWLRQHEGLTFHQAMRKLATDAGIALPAPKEKKRKDAVKGSQADRLTGYALATGALLFHDPSLESYVAMHVNGHLETCALKGKRTKRWLIRLMWDIEGKAARDEVLRATRGVLGAKAEFEGPTYPLHNRVAADANGAIWYDLANESWQAVRITPEAWEMAQPPRPLFRRYAHQRPQSVPQRTDDPKASLWQLFNYANVTEEGERLLLACYVVSLFVPDIAHPILDLYGSKGSGKSVTQKAIRHLVDPSATLVLSMSRQPKEVVQQLAHQYLSYYDNLSSLTDWQVDMLCRACTGEGQTKRRLYTDEEDVVFAFRRCVGMNGIGLASRRADLLDRSIVLGLPPLDKDHRADEQEMIKELLVVRPIMLGAIFSILSGAMPIWGEGEAAYLATQFRMVSFAR